MGGLLTCVRANSSDQPSIDSSALRGIEDLEELEIEAAVEYQRDMDILFTDVTVLDMLLKTEQYALLEEYFEMPLKCMRALIYHEKYELEEDRQRFKDKRPPHRRIMTNFTENQREHIINIMLKIFPSLDPDSVIERYERLLDLDKFK